MKDLLGTVLKRALPNLASHKSPHDTHRDVFGLPSVYSWVCHQAAQKTIQHPSRDGNKHEEYPRRKAAFMSATYVQVTLCLSSLGPGLS